MAEWIKHEDGSLSLRDDGEKLTMVIVESTFTKSWKKGSVVSARMHPDEGGSIDLGIYGTVDEAKANCEKFLSVYKTMPVEVAPKEPVNTPRVTDDMVERATMKLLAHAKDPAPGIDWHCNRQWTVNKVRALMRAALEEVV